MKRENSVSEPFESPSSALEESIGREEFDDHLPSKGLLSFYDHLRDRVVDVVDRRGGRFSSNTVQALLLVPDVFILLLRLSLDKEVPKEQRALLGGALAYFILPIDLLPEAFLGPVGYVDDVVLALAMLSQAFGEELEPFAKKYWSGSRSVRSVLRDVLGAAQSLLGHDVYSRLREVLRKRGVDLDEEVRGTGAD
jgi:uncharacterized membrane protein YkvA (DUF1232 family)